MVEIDWVVVVKGWVACTCHVNESVARVGIGEREWGGRGRERGQ